MEKGKSVGRRKGDRERGRGWEEGGRTEEGGRGDGERKECIKEEERGRERQATSGVHDVYTQD